MIPCSYVVTVTSIWLLMKRYELAGEDVGDRVLEQATDALRYPYEYGDGDNLGLKGCLLIGLRKDSRRGLKLKRWTLVMKRVLMFGTTTITSCSRTT